ncbi:hypothetical protein XENOCAPTIV_022124, partial [Xenoophorus captivus]
EPQACAFTQRPCIQPRQEGFEFCIKHILEDKNAPYKQCSYASAKNGKRCPSPEALLSQLSCFNRSESLDGGRSEASRIPGNIFSLTTNSDADFTLGDKIIVWDLDVEGDGMQGPPSPLQFDTALALEDQTIRAIAEAPMDILTGEDPDQVDLDTSGQELSERDVDAIMDDQVNF